MRKAFLIKATQRSSCQFKGFTIKGNVNPEARKYFCKTISSQTSRILGKKFQKIFGKMRKRNYLGTTSPFWMSLFYLMINMRREHIIIKIFDSSNPI